MLTTDMVLKGIKDPIAALNYVLRMLNINYQAANLGHIVLYINSVCNARCLMCDVGQGNKRGIDAMVYGNKVMSLDMLSKILEDPYLKRKKLTFNITMTEPLLTPNIGEYIGEIKRCGHEVNVTTNGYLLPKKAKELMDAGLDSVQISLDGPKKTNDWIRGRKGFFDNAIRGIKILEGKIPIRVNYTVSNLNYQCMEEFADILNKKVKIGLLKFQFLDFVSEEMSKKQDKYPFKQGISSIDKLVDPEKIKTDILEKQIKNIKKKRYKNIEKIIFIPDISRKEDLQQYFNKEGGAIKKYSACRWPFTQVAINTNGDVFFHLRCFNYIIGNINKKNMRAIFFGGKAEHFRKEFIKAKMCFPACTRCCGVMFNKN